MKKHTLIKIFTACAISISLISCNKESSTNSATATSNKVELSVWVMGDEAKYMNQLATAFEQQNPNITIKVQSIPWGMAHQKLLTALSGNSTPDISMMGSSFMAEFINLGAFEELTPYLNKDDSVKLSQFIPSTLLTNQENGKTYGLPWYADTRVMFYRKDLMEQAGFKEYPKTWDEMTKLTAREKKNGVKIPLTLPKSDVNTPMELLTTLWQNDADLIDSNGKSTVNTPQFKQAVTYYTNYFKNGISSVDQGGDTAALFVNGKIGSFIGGTYMIGLINAASGRQDDFKQKWGVSTLPGNTSSTSVLGGGNFVIFKNSPHKEDAYKFLAYLSSKPAQQQMYQLTHNLPATKSAWDGIESDPVMRVFKIQLDNVKTPLNIQQGPRLYKALSDDVEQVIYGKMTVDAAVTDLNKQVTNIMNSH